MLRTTVARSTRCAGQGLSRNLTSQWQPQRIRQPLRRTWADVRTPDKTVLPGTESKTVAGVPQAPILDANKTAAAAAAAEPVKTPLTPPAPSTNTGKLPPVGTGTAAAGPTSAAPPPPPPPPRRPRRRIRTFFTALLILTALSYAGGVYYSLVSDNFHDFFTEYVPYGEDAVGYFEEREFRKRFPTKEYNQRSWPQVRGENKITIGKQSGLSARVAEEAQDGKSSDLGQKGRHVSAVEDNNKPQSSKAQQTPDEASTREKTQAVEAAKQGKPAKDAPAPKQQTPSSAPATSPKKEAPASAPAPAPAAAQAPPPPPPPPAPSAPSVPLVDHINVPQATEPVVQDLVKMVNNIITAVNATPEGSKFASTVQNMKTDLQNVISAVSTLKDSAAREAESKIKSAHDEFDQAAKELIKRLETEMREQEIKWREEYESEREKLSQSYQQRLAAELDAVRKVEDEKVKKSLLEQEIALQRQYMDTVKAKVEEERSGRLAKLDELSSSVQELEKLTGEWNNVVDAALKTQHLQVAIEAVRVKVLESEYPVPFLDELVALKEVSKDDDIVNAAISTISPVAYQLGVPSVASLIDRFRRVAAEVRKASLLPENAGVASHIGSAVLSRLMFQKKADRGLPEGDDVEATLARTEALLEEGDLDAAAREMNALKGWAGVLSRDWVGECRRVLEVRQAVDVIATEARLQSLLVD